MNLPRAIEWDGTNLRLLDQRRLPGEIVYLTITGIDQAVDAIRTLAVRGAPAIGIAAAYALTVAMSADPPAQRDAFLARLDALAARLRASRPTAVNLAWALERLRARSQRQPTLAALRDEAEHIHREDEAICHAIGRHGAGLITPGCGVLTHCNAGALAVSALGTATAPMYLQHAAGVRFRVFVDETRPLLQGARLTAWELDRAGLDVTLICDSAAASLMAAGEIQLVLVGTDRVTANGDVVNKIGTLGLAVLCRHFGVPFYVACPSSSYDPATPSGIAVPIEQRAAGEVLGSSAAAVPVRNPAFDVTPAELVTGIITEHGIIHPPLAAGLRRLIGDGQPASSSSAT
jgi:methylthioribose-1-phosphate isomerase